MFNEKIADKGQMVELGFIGEQIVFNVLKEKFNAEVVFSEDPWDSEKDMTINGVKCEVKTQIPFITQKSFAVKESQHKKCAEAEVLIFVEPPYHNRYGKNDMIKVWLSKQKDRTGKRIYTQDGRYMIMYHRDQMIKIREIGDDYNIEGLEYKEGLCKKMESLSQSQVKDYR